jgi:hypothetical protein
VDKVTQGNHEIVSLAVKAGRMAATIMSFSLAPEVAAIDMNTGAVKQVSGINKSIYESIKMGKFEEKIY